MSRPGPSGTGRRYLSLALPHLATDRIERWMSPDVRTLPRVTVAMDKSAQRICALNPAALRLGLTPAMALADARARHPGLAVADAAPQQEQVVLERLADACERYTPLLALDAPDGLILDVTGCARLFGGEEGLLRDLLRRVRTAGFRARAALAATAGAAFALARFAAGGRADGPAAAGTGVVVPPEEDLATLLAGLPVEALRLDAGTADAMARLGLRHVGDLAGKPRAPLAARFGAPVLQRLDAALGQVPVAVDYRFPPPVFCAERNLPEPVELVEDVLGLARALAMSLAAALERHGAGARRLELALFRVDGKVTRLAVGTSRPLRDPDAVRRLFAEKVAALTTLDAGFGFDLLRLVVRETGPLPARQAALGAGGAGDAALDGLVDRLSIRFGAARVERLVRHDSHVPETASGTAPAQRAGGWSLVPGAGHAVRMEAGRAAPARDAPPAATEAARRQMVRGMPSGAGSDRGGAAPAILALAPGAVLPGGTGREAAGSDPWSGPAEAGAGAAAGCSSRRGRDGSGAAGWGDADPGPGPMPGEDTPGEDTPGEDAPGKGAAGEGAPAEGADPGMMDPAVPSPDPFLSAPSPFAPSPPDPSLPDLCGPARPLLLLERPEPVDAVAEVPDGPPIRFRWRRLVHVVVRAEGPERIAPPWWCASPAGPVRDYFRVETREGRRFWVYRAGLFGAGGHPAWFLHGVFG